MFLSIYTEFSNPSSFLSLFIPFSKNVLSILALVLSETLSPALFEEYSSPNIITYLMNGLLKIFLIIAPSPAGV